METEEGSSVEGAEPLVANDEPESRAHALRLQLCTLIQEARTRMAPFTLWCTEHRYLLLGHTAILALLLIAVGGLTVQSRDEVPPWQNYSGSYRLVPDTISQSAAIALSLPDNVRDITKDQLSFSPKLEGSLIRTDSEDVILFKPSSLPEVGSYYNVVLSYGTTTLGADFLVADDPSVVSILPSNDAETHEDTEVSVIFNRPMVPLSTRDAMDKEAIPVRLEPDVPGIWKWKSTRLLQFIPEEDLVRATNYKVTVNEGFRSMDGVPVKGFTHTFVTRTLKQHPTPEAVGFDQPLVISFNQPVDLERTAHELTLTKDGRSYDAIVSYAKKETEKPRIFGLALFSNSEEVDTTKLAVRPAKDKHGRKGFWDFESSYTLSVAKKYPLEGDIVDETVLRWSYTLPPVLSSLEAASERSVHVSPDFFDPEGALVARFFEPVLLKDTKISLKGLKDVQYEKKCKEDEDGNAIIDRTTRECEKIDDTRALRITVHANEYGKEEQTDVRFERIVSEAGHLLNTEPIVRPIRTVPELRILRTIPADTDKAASLTNLTICTNSPLKRPEVVRDEVLRTSGYTVYPNRSWVNSFKVTNDRQSCRRGEYQTGIRYGLHPETPYTLSLNVPDDFDQRAARELNVTTESVKSPYTRFHSLQKWYNVTMPGKTRLTYAVENLPYVVAHLCKVSGTAFLRTLEKSSLSNGLPPASLCTEVRTANIDLPDTYWVNNYFYFDLKDYFPDTRGHYIITFTHPNYRDSKGVQQYEHTLVSVSNLAVGEKRVDWYRYYRDTTQRAGTVTAKNLYWVLNATTLEPVIGASVTSFVGTKTFDKDRTIQQSGVAVTDTEGVARLAAQERTRGAVVSSGSDSAVVSANTDTLEHNVGMGGETATYLYSDRPIYRPGDTVYVKGIDRVGYDHNWRVPETYNAKVEIHDSRGDVVSTQTVPVSIYGTFDLSIELPEDAPLGTYRISAFEGSGWFDVEEYVGAPFKVELTAENPEYIAGETASMDITAGYYFDMPVAGGEVEYTVLAQDYHFDRYKDEYFSFGGGWYSCYWCGYGDEFITRGTTELDGSGNATVEVPLTFAKYFDDPDTTGSKLFTVIARVKDATGKQVSGQQTVIVHRGEHYLGVKTGSYVAAKGENVAVRVKSVDTNGTPTSLRDITLRASRVEWESYKRREVDGGYYWHSEEKKTMVEERTVSTDREGNAQSDLAFAEPGTYELTVLSTDKSGNAVQSSTQIHVWGEGHVSVRPTNNATLDITTDKPSYKSGEEATVLIESPFTEARALITVERGDIYQYWTTRVTSSLFAQKVPLLPSYAPSVYTSVLLLGKGLDVKYGTTELRSDTEVHDLVIEVTPSKKAYLPGEEVELLVRTKDHTGNPVPADVSVAVVDMSVLALKGNPKKDPSGFFYGSLPLSVSTAHSAKNMLVQQDIPTGTKGGGGGEDLERRKRGIFEDTAHWQARVITDGSGQATVRFTLPDNLTTWQIESLGVTTDTKVGVNYLEFVSKKSVMAVPLRPRFVIPGDTLWLGLQVSNNTERDLTLDTHVRSDTLTVLDEDPKSVSVGAGKQTVVYFKTEAPRSRKSGMHVATFSAVHEDFEDVVEQSIPILEDKTYEVTATAGMTTLPAVFESVYIPEYALPDEGELTVRAQPTLVASLVSAVRDMAGYPYGCSEQIASRLASLATIRRTGDLFGEESVSKIQGIVFDDTKYDVDAAVDLGLKELLGRQFGSGGFSFYPESYVPSLYLTVEVITALNTLRDAGYDVPDDVFARAATYMVDEFASHAEYGQDHDLVARVAFALASPYVPEQERVRFTPLVTTIGNDMLALEQLSTTALGYFAIATYSGPYEKPVANSFYAALENRLTIDARGAYVKSLRNGVHSWFESNEKNTALLVRAIAERGGTHATLDNLLRWLLTSKRETGGWGSTNATYTVLDAALRLAEVREENKADFMLTLLKDGESVATHRVTPATVFDNLTYSFPIGSFTREYLHQIAIKKSEDEGKGTIYYDMQLRYALPPDMVPPRDEGFTILRSLSLHGTDEPIKEAQVGDLVIGTLDITVPKTAHAVSIESFVPAGFEIVNFSFSTEASRDLEFADDGARLDEPEQHSWYEPERGPRAWPTTYEELHDDRVFVFAEEVPAGTYTYEYTLRALVPGTFRHMPATVKEMYTPEVFGRTEGSTFTVTAQ